MSDILLAPSAVGILHGELLIVVIQDAKETLARLVFWFAALLIAGGGSVFGAAAGASLAEVVGEELLGLRGGG